MRNNEKSKLVTKSDGVEYDREKTFGKTLYIHLKTEFLHTKKKKKNT